MNTRLKNGKILTSIYFVAYLLVSANVFALSPMDSIGVRQENNKTFIVHRVEQGETVYGLARKYEVSPNSILELNKEAEKGLNIGDEIKIPYNGKIEPAKTGQVTHKVRSGETLSVIAEKYNVSVKDIKNWNKLKSNTLSIGQELTINTSSEFANNYNKDKEIRENNGKKIHIVNKGETLYSISNAYEISTDDIKEWNRMESNNLYIGQELVVGFTENKDIVITNTLEVPSESKPDEIKTYEIEGKPMTKAESTGDFKKVTEKGVARVIEGSETTKKYLALHRSAPIGTIMQVKNEMNDLSVFVRVIGKLPDTGENRKLLLKISRTAYDRLNAYDNQFPVEITYHP